MEKTSFEELVCHALLELNSRQYAGLAARADGVEYVPSPRHLAWEKRFLSSPFSYAKKHARPMWRRALQTAACILLAASVAFGGLMAASPAARAWVQQIFAQWFGNYARFSFSGNAGQETGDWRTTWLPEGFELVEETSGYVLAETTYTNSSNQSIRFLYGPASGSSFITDAEHQTSEEIDINGSHAYLLRSALSGKTSYLVWTDSANETAFKLTTTAAADDLVRIAESIQKIK